MGSLASYYGFAFGFANRAGTQSVAVGYQCIATQRASAALGMWALARSNATAIGAVSHLHLQVGGSDVVALDASTMSVRVDNVVWQSPSNVRQSLELGSAALASSNDFAGPWIALGEHQRFTSPGWTYGPLYPPTGYGTAIGIGTQSWVEVQWAAPYSWSGMVVVVEWLVHTTQPARTYYAHAYSMAARCGNVSSTIAPSNAAHISGGWGLLRTTNTVIYTEPSYYGTPTHVGIGFDKAVPGATMCNYIARVLVRPL